MPFSKGLEAMGLDTVELVISLEEAFEIEIPDEVAERLTTPREIIDYLGTRLPSYYWPRERIAEKVRQVIIHETGVNDFDEDSRFVEDMGLD